MSKIHVTKYDDNDYKEFLKKALVDFNFKSIGSFDYSWVLEFLEYFVSLDNIVMNPRKFIESDELVVPVEKAKRITRESVKHLSQHTEYIRDFDEEGMPKPSKVLNIYKEETYDLYENRFIKSLIDRLYNFLTVEKDKLFAIDNSTASSLNIVSYKSKSQLNSLEYASDLKIKIKNKNEKIDLQSIKDKFNELYDYILSFKNSLLMRELENARAVNSPIRRTNAILKDPDLHKCLELWEMLEALEVSIKSDNQNQVVDIDESEFLKTLNLTNYLNYCSLANHKVKSRLGQQDNFEVMLEDIINVYLNTSSFNIKTFRTNLYSDLDKICTKYESEYKSVKDTYDKYFNSFLKL